MKLSKLREQAEETIPSDIPSEEDTIKVNARDRINMTIKRWKREYISDKKLQIPEGMIRVSCIFDNDLVDKKDRPTIELGVTYKPNMDPKPVIPRDFVANSVDLFIEDMKKMCSDILDESLFPHEVLNEYDVSLYSVAIYPSEGIINLFDYIPRPLYNTIVRTPRKLGDLLVNRSLLLDLYTFDENVLPKFSDDYTQAMDRAIRKCKTVYTALEKGTWNGYNYSLTPFNVSSVVIHQDKSDYTVESGVLHPNFSISYSGGWPSLNGDKINTIFPVEVQDEFTAFIKKRFKNLGINFS